MSPSARPDKRELLDRLARSGTPCCRCAAGLACVFGAGNPEAGIVFVGEAPGYEENRKGVPFVGRAGKLLDRLLEDLGIDREDVYITNVVKCRPMKDPAHPRKPGNDRRPTKREVAACLPVLERQLGIIRPKVVVTLGNTPLQALLHTSDGIGIRHGKLEERNGIRLLPTYHPAAALRNPALRETIREDLRGLRGAAAALP